MRPNFKRLLFWSDTHAARRSLAHTSSPQNYSSHLVKSIPTCSKNDAPPASHFLMPAAQNSLSLHPVLVSPLSLARTRPSISDSAASATEEGREEREEERGRGRRPFRPRRRRRKVPTAATAANVRLRRPRLVRSPTVSSPRTGFEQPAFPQLLCQGC